MDKDYGLGYRELFENHWWWRAREDVIVETLRRYRPADGWRAILDVGCGDGLFFDRLAEFGEVIEGVEPAAELVTQSNERRGTIYITGFDESFQPEREYSLILMLDVLEHLPKPVEALRRVTGLLEPGGLFIATVPAFPILWTRHDDVNHHFIRYTKRTFGEVARAAGLHVAHQEYFFHWTFPAKLLVRAAERVLPSGDAVEKVPAPWINSALLRLSRLERSVFRGFPPFGSSLIAACHTEAAGE